MPTAQNRFIKYFIFLSQDWGEKGHHQKSKWDNSLHVSMTFATIDAHLGYGIRYVGFIAPVMNFDQ